MQHVAQVAEQKARRLITLLWRWITPILLLARWRQHECNECILWWTRQYEWHLWQHSSREWISTSNFEHANPMNYMVVTCILEETQPILIVQQLLFFRKTQSHSVCLAIQADILCLLFKIVQINGNQHDPSNSGPLMQQLTYDKAYHYPHPQTSMSNIVKQ